MVTVFCNHCGRKMRDGEGTYVGLSFSKGLRADPLLDDPWHEMHFCDECMKPQVEMMKQHSKYPPVKERKPDGAE